MTTVTNDTLKIKNGYSQEAEYMNWINLAQDGIGDGYEPSVSINGAEFLEKQGADYKLSN
jgi:hypothetical protein